MKIKKIIWQNRRDFRAIFICQYCNHEKEMDGYDDRNFHDNVIPIFICGACGKRGGEYTPMDTKYPEGYQV